MYSQTLIPFQNAALRQNKGHLSSSFVKSKANRYNIIRMRTAGGACVNVTLMYRVDGHTLYVIYYNGMEYSILHIACCIQHIGPSAAYVVYDT